MFLRCFRLAPGAALVAASLSAFAAPVPVTTSQKIADVTARLNALPDDARPMVRWWWFGPAVEKAQLEREMLAMKAGGYGGFEIQPVYPMELDDPARGIKNVQYNSPAFLDAVSFVNTKARANKLRVDMTLASGWPYGGPNVPVTEASSRLRMAVVEVPANGAGFAMPALMSGESLVASFVGEGSAKDFDPLKLNQLTVGPLTSGRAAIAPAAASRVVVCYIGTRTGQQVKRAALGAEGFVLDHLSRTAIDHHLKVVAEPLLKAFGKNPPYAVFSDSLEVYGADWTDDMLAQFRQRRGYDLTPYLPQIMSGKGPDAAAVRHDWALTQTELVNERYLTPVNNWAHAHGTQFRSQTYGEPIVSLSSNRLVDLPEGEGPQFRAFSFTRLATSAGHLFNRPVISAETWTWLNSPAFAATPLDVKAEADRMLLQGINQFIGHGWPYSPPGAVEPGYSFYAAGVFNHHNPWWNVMPDVNSYLTRTSYLMRQGKPANQVAVLLPNDDAYALVEPGKMSLSGEMRKFVKPELVEQILDAGHNFDYIDPEAVLALGVQYPVLVMPNTSRLSPAVLAKLADYVKGGGKLIAIGSKPSLAPGLIDADKIGKQVADASAALFAAGQNVQFVEKEAALGTALKAALPGDMQLSSNASDVGFVHRKLADADIYFIANTSNHEVSASASFGSTRKLASWINPHDGKISSAPAKPELKLAPYESRVLVFSDAPLAGTPAPSLGAPAVLADLSSDWQVKFPGQAAPVGMRSLRSWTEDEATRYFSGEAVYSKEVTLAEGDVKGMRMTLDFGPGTPLASTPKVPSGMRAMLDAPLREAAQVYVNGMKAGAVWHPPYSIEIGALLKPGVNKLEVRVANLALNVLAGHALPDYRLLSSRYTARFAPQDTELIAPRPAGILGPVKLIGEKLQ